MSDIIKETEKYLDFYYGKDFKATAVDKTYKIVCDLKSALEVINKTNEQQQRTIKETQRESDKLNVSNHELAWKYKIIQEENKEQQAKIDKLNNSIQMRDAMDAGDSVLISENELLNSKTEQQQQTIQDLAEALNESANELHGASECIKCFTNKVATTSGYEVYVNKYRALAAQHIKGDKNE